jgi:hypothetical protein
MNKEDFTQYQGPKINYSFEELDAITILPNRFIKQKEFSSFEPEVSWVNNIPVLFHECADVALPFDPFSAAFYLITRYEEYGASHSDMHGRFMATSSLAYRHKFLDVPIIDLWAQMILDVLRLHYPQHSFPEKKFTYIPTIDVDIAYAYKGRSLLRNIGAVLKSGLNMKEQSVRLRTWMGNLPDSYHTFDRIDNWHGKWKLSPVFFFQVGAYGKFDKNLPPHHPLMKNLIQEVSRASAIGIHPSYASYLNKEIVEKEITTLTALTGRSVTKSRQHFLRLKLPDTYQLLEQCGIRDDYSMGYADHIGFRAGTCTPFRFYDLSTETETNLRIIPFCVMDGTLNQYMHLNPGEAILKTCEIALKISGRGHNGYHMAQSVV